MHVSIPIFERQLGSRIEWTTLRLGGDTLSHTAYSTGRIEQRLTDQLRKLIAATRPHEMDRFQLARGMDLVNVRLELTLTGEEGRRKVSGVVPLVVEPRWVSEDERVRIVYHPMRQLEPFWLADGDDLAALARRHFQRAWADVDGNVLNLLFERARTRLRVLSFAAEPRSIFADLPKERAIGSDGASDDEIRRRQGLKVLPDLGVNLTQKAARGALDDGVPRTPYREQLQLLLATRKKQPTIVVGLPGSGKTTLIHRLISDLLDADGFPAHRNLDRAHAVWSVSGKRIIAGMTQLGEWEKRVSELLGDARRESIVLYVPDLAHFGRIGRSQESDRALADMFRGPLAQRKITILGECTPAELRQLTDDAPGFAALFHVVHVREATNEETFRLMLRAVRALERRYDVHVHPGAIRAVLETAGALLSGRARPGRAIDLLVELARKTHAGDGGEVRAQDVVAALAAKTGLPKVLLESAEKLDVDAVERGLAAQVRGQPDAVRVAASLIARIKSGLSDPRRPHGVYLFTGPTGTGKTELAKCIAEYLYGNASRLVRFDMSELAGPDAPARLIGDRYRPEGLLTQRILEQPFAVVLLDEIEKAHPSVLNLLLQLFDDGRLTDASGTAVDFTQTAIVMTSNLGARSRATLGFGEAEGAVMADVARAVRDFFPPELWNRIDRIVPFRPLTLEIATDVAKKELAKLLARPGLAERNVIVHANASVPARMAQEAFRAEDGARSVKRYLEDRIGSILTDALAGEAGAAMQIVRIYAARGGFGVAREALREAEPAPGGSPLEPLLGLSVARLKEHLPALQTFLATVEQGDALAHVAEQLRAHLRGHSLGDTELATQVFNLDAMRGAVAAFRERVDALTQADDHYERLEMQKFGTTTVAFGDYHRTQRSYRLFRRDMFSPPSRAHAKDEILASIAEGHFLRRALRTVDDPDRHAVFIDLVRAFEPPPAERFEAPRAGLLEALTRIYATSRGGLEGCAARTPDYVGPFAPSALDATLARHPSIVVLRIVGLSVLDVFELETGTHVWHLRDGAEVVTVRVVPAAPNATALERLTAHDDRIARYERALDDGDAAASAEGRAPSLPLVRVLRFDPPRRPGDVAPADVEDHALGYATVVHARTLEDVIAPLALLAMSREGAPS